MQKSYRNEISMLAVVYKRPVGSSRSHNSAEMAQSVPPGDINTQPGTKIVFNAPYDDKHTYHIKVL